MKELKNCWTTEDFIKRGLIETAPGVWEKPAIKKHQVTAKEMLIRLKKEVDKLPTKKEVQAVNGVCKINIKPMTNNRAWQGRRFRSKEYNDYEKAVMVLLPKMDMPAPPFKIYYEFGHSNKAADVDNGIKAIQDILSKRYNFNDNQVMEIHAKKVIVEKGKEYFLFHIQPI